MSEFPYDMNIVFPKFRVRASETLLPVLIFVDASEHEVFWNRCCRKAVVIVMVGQNIEKMVFSKIAPNFRKVFGFVHLGL